MTAPAANPNPIVADILRGADPGAPTPPAPRAKATARPEVRVLSQHPEAQRARSRRAAARSAHPTGAPPTARPTFARIRPAEGPVMLPADLPPAPPPPVVASPDQADKAKRNIAMVIRGAGWLASALFKAEYMRVPERDAIETAEAILDGYPDLATESDADYKKLMAWVAVGSLAFERAGRYRRERAGLPAAAAAPASAPVPEERPWRTTTGPTLEEIRLL